MYSNLIGEVLQKSQVRSIRNWRGQMYVYTWTRLKECVRIVTVIALIVSAYSNGEKGVSLCM